MKASNERPGAAPQPTPASLHEAALAYLSRYAASEARLVRVLDRHCERWARRSGGEEAAAALPGLRLTVREVAARLVAAGAIDDIAFASSRARTLARSGRSRRAIAAHLAAHGVGNDVSRNALPEDPEAELTAALALTRRRRIGPFRQSDGPGDFRRELGMLARAGFSHDVATRALSTAPDIAEVLLARLRRG
jgi:regulatory protein